jgi:hypothetical protein
MMTSGNLSGQKDGKDFTFPINISLSVTKDGGKWLIANAKQLTLARLLPNHFLRILVFSDFKKNRLTRTSSKATLGGITSQY